MSRIIQEIAAAIDSRDYSRMRELILGNLRFLEEGGWIRYFMTSAAVDNHLEVISTVVDLGIDVNLPESENRPEGVIGEASGNGSLEVVKWLLEHGAKLNYEVKGTTRCLPLSAAITSGHLDIVKLLIAYGAAFNAVWKGESALSLAILHNQTTIATYLRSLGATLPSESQSQLDRTRTTDECQEELLEHIRTHLGDPSPLSLQAILPTDPSITIYSVQMSVGTALVTNGMSAYPMIVPNGAEGFQFAELVMYLPENWPVTNEALSDPNSAWPVEWLRRIALYPHLNHIWLGGKAVVFANGDPPQPLAPNTKLSCILAITESSEFGYLRRNDGSQIVFYTLVPLYTEERDLEKREGTATLLGRFQERGIRRVVDISRPSVA